MRIMHIYIRAYCTAIITVYSKVETRTPVHAHCTACHTCTVSWRSQLRIPINVAMLFFSDCHDFPLHCPEFYMYIHVYAHIHMQGFRVDGDREGLGGDDYE